MTGAAVQSVLTPAGAQASTIYHLWFLMLWVSVAVFAAVLTVLVMAVARGRSRHPVPASPPNGEPTRSHVERTLSRGVAAAVAVTIVILIALLAVSVWTGRTVASLQASSAVTVNVIGHQWWWEIEYEDGIASRRVRTANEIHIPVGQPVVFKVTSRDVVHSFWIPNLQGKRDLIPGYTTAIWLRADRPGRFRGQCAEFCGLQHAHMALDVTAEPGAEFEHWLDARREPARAPADDVQARGRGVFMTARCAGCHAIRGTDAAGQVAPDLTHLASRHTLGAGTLPNTREHLLSWIRDPQDSKPGNQMPPNSLTSGDFEALLSYLESLR
jgi:cytochrome c oxidase subunit 2